MTGLQGPEPLPSIDVPRYCGYSDQEKAALWMHVFEEAFPGLESELCHRFNAGECRHWMRQQFLSLFPPGTKLSHVAHFWVSTMPSLSPPATAAEISFPVFFQLLRYLGIHFKDLPNRPADVVSVLAGISTAVPRVPSRLILRFAPGSRLSDNHEDPLPKSDSAQIFALVLDDRRCENWIGIATFCGGDLAYALTLSSFQDLLIDILTDAARLVATDDEGSSQLRKWTTAGPVSQEFAAHLVQLWNDYYMPTEIAREAISTLFLLDDK